MIPHRILLVDDDPNILNALRRALGTKVSDGCTTFEIDIELFNLPEAALSRAREMKFDLVMSDFRMPIMDGVSFLKSFRALQPDAARLILSGFTDQEGLVGAINDAQIYRFINKPWQQYELSVTIAQALAYNNLLQENQRMADVVRVQQGKLSLQEVELRRLEKENPGITQVNWGPNGEVLLDEHAL